MKSIRRLNLLSGFVAFLWAVAALAAAPDWLLEVARRPPPNYSADVPAVVLLDELVTTIAPSGRRSTERRYALRIFNVSGKAFAKGTVHFNGEEDKVNDTAAWIVRGGKEVRLAKKPEWIDVSLASGGAIFSEMRMKIVDCTETVLSGDVFGYETKVDEAQLFAQLSYEWGSSLPVVNERVVLKLPPNWSVQSVLDGPMAPALRSSTAERLWAWELQDRAYRPEEPAMSPDAFVDARLFLTLVPPAQFRNPYPVFQRWADVSAWLCPLQDSQCDTNAALAEATQKLIANSDDPLGRLRVLSRHVQGVRYISYDKGLQKGFGYRPRKATEVMAKGWGDCKAKANLLRAMLREIGVQSYMVEVNASTGRNIVDVWTTPLPFNHAILAIQAESTINFPAVVDCPKLGRLLFFDVTNPDVLLGDLPRNLQGAKVHVVAPGSDGLITLPLLPAETSHRGEIKVTATLDATGGIAGDLIYGGSGSVGTIVRAFTRRHSSKEHRDHLTENLNASVRGAVIEDSSTIDDEQTGDCRIKYRFSSPRFMQMLPGGSAVVRFDILNRDSVPVFPAKERNLPVKLNVMVHRDEVTLKLPAGYGVEELPDNTELKSPYGHYASSYVFADGSVVARRELKLEDRVVPVSEYGALRKFLGDVAKADHSSVVLRQE